MQPVELRKRVTLGPATDGPRLYWAEGDRQHVWPVTDALASRQWFRMDLRPVRSPSSPPGSRSIAGLYFWTRNQSYVWFESQTEKRVLRWLDFEGDVVAVRSQPFLLQHARTAQGAWHVPDFMVQHANQDITVIDVKPQARRNERTEIQFQQTAEAMDKLGFGYAVHDAPSPIVSENITWLASSRHTRCRPPADVVERILLSARTGLTVAQLRRAASPELPARASAWIDHLVWHRHLTFNLNHPYKSDTILTTHGALT